MLAFPFWLTIFDCIYATQRRKHKRANNSNLQNSTRIPLWLWDAGSECIKKIISLPRFNSCCRVTVCVCTSVSGSYSAVPCWWLPIWLSLSYNYCKIVKILNLSFYIEPQVRFVFKLDSLSGRATAVLIQLDNSRQLLPDPRLTHIILVRLLSFKYFCVNFPCLLTNTNSIRRFIFSFKYKLR